MPEQWSNDFNSYVEYFPILFSFEIVFKIRDALIVFLSFCRNDFRLCFGRIRFLSSSAFASCERLERIDLSGNQLESFSLNVIAGNYDLVLQA